ncbi:MAG: hypothetical protein ABSA41_12555 [Terriglobia bacterium]|jgi:hypothetical protein
MKEFYFLTGGFVAGVVVTRVFYAKALAEYKAGRAWVEGEISRVPPWLAAKISRL